MRRPILASLAAGALLTLTGCGGGSSSSKKTLPLDQLISRIRSGVVRIETTTCSGSETGTGIVVGSHLVATVEHVVHGATAISLVRNGQPVGKGTVVGRDAARDVALVHSDRAITGYKFSFATIPPALGDDVAAIGFPLGLPLSVTRGTISGLDRAIPISGTKRHRLIQTDAPVNPGNSGGPLVALDGSVVGLVDLGSLRANGVAFAVSANVASPLLQVWRAAPQPVPAAVCALPPDVYVARMQTIGRGLSTSLNALSSVANEPASAAVALTNVQRDLDEAAREVEAIKAPLDVEADQHALALAIRDFANELTPIIQEVEAGDTGAIAQLTSLQGVTEIGTASNAITRKGYPIGG